eukprot:gnl/MRDRNA2_/MRDRNA2_131526_c0_seq1.p2 gnl/MRDRNA2_/MRDRNA2_131526_c0~~gnl/MRDRNA2_/MRDRNA2_131526_c0_seq1.p2  ORF type:complete len:139 (-),score=23.73 gnl/MRDRNA2_/MRDRNA2_131526_c0_seq1:90-506(-)
MNASAWFMVLLALCIIPVTTSRRISKRTGPMADEEGKNNTTNFTADPGAGAKCCLCLAPDVEIWDASRWQDKPGSWADEYAVTVVDECVPGTLTTTEACIDEPSFPCAHVGSTIRTRFGDNPGQRCFMRHVAGLKPLC